MDDGHEAVAKLVNLPSDHCIGPLVAVGKGTKAPWPKPGQLSLDEVQRPLAAALPRQDESDAEIDSLVFLAQLERINTTLPEGVRIVPYYEQKGSEGKLRSLDVSFDGD